WRRLSPTRGAGSWRSATPRSTRSSWPGLGRRALPARRCSHAFRRTGPVLATVAPAPLRAGVGGSRVRCRGRDVPAAARPLGGADAWVPRLDARCVRAELRHGGVRLRFRRAAGDGRFVFPITTVRAAGADGGAGGLADAARRGGGDDAVGRVGVLRPAALRLR